MSRPLERRARPRREELGPSLPVEPEELRGVVRAAREEALENARARKLPVLLRDLVTPGRVVPPAPLAPRDKVHGRHAVHGSVSSEETGDARGVEGEARAREGVVDHSVGLGSGLGDGCHSRGVSEERSRIIRGREGGEAGDVAGGA